ncbi:MAG: hypothetical protein LBM95_02785 [Lactobacillales bacterium]|jgi:uncharacterized membrane protein (DUF4010 family)|nr:hypothetical protein [Lactobacillales bacterium]
MKLPRDRREFMLFLAIVSILSVNMIAPLITCFEVGFSFHTWANTLRVLPFIWLVVVALVLLTHEPATKVTNKLIDQKDSFSSHIIVNTLVNVAMMSVVLTIVATWIGTKSITWEPIQHFFYRWPRNFSISLFVEMIIAQPFARWVLYKRHLKIDTKQHRIQS